MSTLMRGACFLSGFRFKDDRVAGSVARAKAAKVSMILRLHVRHTTLDFEDES